MVKKYIYLLYIASLGYLLSCSEATHKDAVDYVNPNIGTIGHLLVATASMVQLPHGMVQVGQNPYPELADRYLADKVSGFSIRALPRYATKPLSGIMATIGEAQINSEKYASFFDHDFEVVTPYFSSLLLENYNIEASMTVTSHTSFYKFKFPESKKANILINNNAQIKITGENTIESIEQVDTVQKAYYYAKFSKPISSYITWNDSVQSTQDEQTGTRIGALVSFSTKQNEEVLVKIGVSFIDTLTPQRILEK